MSGPLSALNIIIPHFQKNAIPFDKFFGPNGRGAPLAPNSAAGSFVRAAGPVCTGTILYSLHPAFGHFDEADVCVFASDRFPTEKIFSLVNKCPA